MKANSREAYIASEFDRLVRGGADLPKMQIVLGDTRTKWINIHLEDLDWIKAVILARECANTLNNEVNNL